MPKAEKISIWMFLGVVVLVVGYIFVSRRNASTASAVTTAQPNAATPNYLSYNYPGTNPNWSGNAVGLPTLAQVAAPGGLTINLGSPSGSTSSSGCGCGCASSPSAGGCSTTSGNIYSSLASLISSYGAGATQAFDAYQKQVYESYPDYVSQYFNNPVGYSQSQELANVVSV